MFFKLSDKEKHNMKKKSGHRRNRSSSSSSGDELLQGYMKALQEKESQLNKWKADEEMAEKEAEKAEAKKKRLGLIPGGGNSDDDSFTESSPVSTSHRRHIREGKRDRDGLPQRHHERRTDIRSRSPTRKYDRNYSRKWGPSGSREPYSPSKTESSTRPHKTSQRSRSRSRRGHRRSRSRSNPRTRDRYEPRSSSLKRKERSHFERKRYVGTKFS